MKRLLFSAALATVFLGSCSKQQSDSSNAVSGDMNITAQKPKGQHYEDKLHDCYDPAGNCGSGAVVSRPRKKVFDDLKVAIEGGIVPVHDFFNTEAGLSMSEYFGDDLIGNLSAGTYTVIADHNPDGRDFYLVGNVNSLNLTNAEFVLPVSFE